MAFCTFSTSGWVALPLVENESMATRGSRPVTAWKFRAELIAMSASCASFGSGFTAQSAKQSIRPSVSTMMK